MKRIVNGIILGTAVVLVLGPLCSAPANAFLGFGKKKSGDNFDQALEIYSNPAALNKTLEYHPPKYNFDNQHAEIFDKNSPRAVKARQRQKFLAQSMDFQKHPEALTGPMIMEPKESFFARLKGKLTSTPDQAILDKVKKAQTQQKRRQLSLQPADN